MVGGVKAPERLGICFDTAHALAAGYELRTREGFDATWAQFNELLGWNRLRAIHLNDSKKGLGSRVDRTTTSAKARWPGTVPLLLTTRAFEAFP